MSTLTDIEKRYLEKLLGMGDGYVLGFSDATYGGFFKRHRINIHGPKYQTYGTSKAKKMRSFWEQESDIVVGKVLTEMLDSYEADCELSNRDIDRPILDKGRGIIDRLVGKKPNVKEAPIINDFLDREFMIPNIGKLPIDTPVVPIAGIRNSGR